MREVDDAVRQGDAQDFLSKWGKPLLALLIVGLLGFAGYLYWQNRQEAAMERNSEMLVAGLDQLQAGNLDTAFSSLEELAASGEGGAATAAAMLRAGIAAEQGRSQEAAEMFGAVAASADTPPALRDLAKVREVALRYDELTNQQVIAELQGLARPGQPFFGSAGELVAHAYLEQGDEAEAGALFAQIAKADDVPETLRSRARQLAGVLGVDAIEDVDAVLQEQGVTSDDAADETAPVTQ